jgi:putative transposase
VDKSRIQPKRELKGWYCRGYLPHLDWPCLQFLTFRQHDSFPRSVLENWRVELRALSDRALRAEEYRRIEEYMDQGKGSCILKQGWAAIIVDGKLLAMHGSAFDLKGWVIMPNHVHLLASFRNVAFIPKVVADLKGSTAREINLILGRTGTSFWFRDYFDRFIRDQEHFENTLAYIHRNPVKAKLCDHFLDFPHSSARFLFERVGDHVYESGRLNPALPVQEPESRFAQWDATSAEEPVGEQENGLPNQALRVQECEARVKPSRSSSP